jgi:hypothetical protein
LERDVSHARDHRNKPRHRGLEAVFTIRRRVVRDIDPRASLNPVQDIDHVERDIAADIGIRMVDCYVKETRICEWWGRDPGLGDVAA